MELRGKRTLVTGATGGLGWAIARALHARGAELVLTGRREDALEELRAELGDGVHTLPFDLAGAASAAGLAEQAGEVDVLVANAALPGSGRYDDFSADEMDRALDVNLRGVFFSAQAGAAQMVRQGHGGKIVNIASIMGLVGSATSSVAYCASKGGVVNLTRVLAIEWASHNIQVNGVAPTFVRTPLTAGVFQNEAFLASVLSRTPNGKLATPEAIADAVVFLASPRADMITGTTLPVDGGWTAW